MDSVTRRRLLASIGAAGGLVSGCVGAPSAPSGTPTTSAAPTDAASASEYPTRPGIRLGQADVELHPREAVAFTDEVARLRCTCVAADAVETHLAERIDPTGIGVGCGRTPILATPIEDTGFAVNVHHTTTFDRDGDLHSEPAVGYDRLRAVTPRTVSATIDHEGAAHTCTVPVYVIREEGHVD